MSEKEKKLSAEDQKALEAAKATIRRLEGEPPPPDPEAAPMRVRRFRVLLDGVTWIEKTKEYLDCRTRGMVRDEKGDTFADIVIRDEETGRPKRVRVRAREVTIDRAIVQAYNEADAWEKFRKSWGISNSNHTPRFVEVRNLTERERASPPADVIEPVPGVLFGVPAPVVLPLHADPEYAAPIIPVDGPLTRQEVVLQALASGKPG
jgi:hypothetical protein